MAVCMHISLQPLGYYSYFVSTSAATVVSLSSALAPLCHRSTSHSTYIHTHYMHICSSLLYIYVVAVDLLDNRAGIIIERNVERLLLCSCLRRGSPSSANTNAYKCFSAGAHANACISVACQLLLLPVFRRVSKWLHFFCLSTSFSFFCSLALDCRLVCVKILFCPLCVYVRACACERVCVYAVALGKLIYT